MTLFIRSKKGLQLTEDGADFLHIVQPIVTSYENFLNVKAEKNMLPVLNVYTTPTLSAYISNLLDVSFDEVCFLSMHKRNVNEMIDMLESNHQGVFLIPIYNGYPQIAADWKNKIHSDVDLQKKKLVIYESKIIYPQKIKQLLIEL